MNAHVPRYAAPGPDACPAIRAAKENSMNDESPQPAHDKRPAKAWLRLLVVACHLLMLAWLNLLVWAACGLCGDYMDKLSGWNAPALHFLPGVGAGVVSLMSIALLGLESRLALAARPRPRWRRLVGGAWQCLLCCALCALGHSLLLILGVVYNFLPMGS